jgi:hypothetical protein
MRVSMEFTMSERDPGESQFFVDVASPFGMPHFIRDLASNGALWGHNRKTPPGALLPPVQEKMLPGEPEVVALANAGRH